MRTLFTIPSLGTLCLLAPMVDSFAQGEFIFNNHSAAVAPITILDATTGLCILPSGDNWHVDVLAGLQGSAVATLEPLGTTTFHVGTGAGFVFGTTVTVPDSTDNELASVWLHIYSGPQWTTSSSR